jgi:CHASE2 domain-containing sensor protein
MEFLSPKEKAQLQRILTRSSQLQTSDERRNFLIFCGLEDYCGLVQLDQPLGKFVISLCSTLSKVYIIVEDYEKLGLIVFLEYLSQTDLNLAAADRKFLEHVIGKWNLDQKDSSENVLSLEQTNVPVRPLTWKHLWAVSFTVTFVLFVLRFLGLLEAMELKAFDHLMQFRLLDEPADSRLLVVEITDKDLKAQLTRKEQGQGTLKDTSLNRLLQKLEQYQPRLIGLNLFRDFETSADKPNLVARFSNERFFAACKVPKTDEQQKVIADGFAPPREVIQEERFGFSDVIPDRDQVIRRFLMAQDKVSGAECRTKQSFSLALARRYLELESSQNNKYEYKDPFESQTDLQIGNAIFKQLQPFTGGYQHVNASGYQVLLNYRATGENPKAIAKHVSVEDVLNDRLSEQDVRDKIVLIGITAKDAIEDEQLTPYGRMSSIFVHAHMISQILSFAKGERSLLKVWSPGIEFLWIGCWSLAGAVFACYFRFSWRMIGIAGGATLFLYVTCLCLLTWGSLWVPLVPSAIGLFFTGGTVLYIIYRPYQKISDPMTKS